MRADLPSIGFALDRQTGLALLRAGEQSHGGSLIQRAPGHSKLFEQFRAERHVAVFCRPCPADVDPRRSPSISGPSAGIPSVRRMRLAYRIVSSVREEGCLRTRSCARLRRGSGSSAGNAALWAWARRRGATACAALSEEESEGCHPYLDRVRRQLPVKDHINLELAHIVGPDLAGGRRNLFRELPDSDVGACGSLGVSYRLELPEPDLVRWATVQTILSHSWRLA